MKKFQAIIMVALIANIASADNLNPLSKYSPQWNLDMYQKANTAANLGFLTKQEKDFLFVINMARMNPFLFCNSVLLPYAQKNGYTTPIMLTIEKMKGSQQYSTLNADEFFASSVKKWVQQKSLAAYTGAGYPDSLYLKDPMMKNSVLLISETANPVELLCKMIADGESGYHSIRRHLTSEYVSIGLNMQVVGNKTIISMLFSDQPSVAYKDPKGYELSKRYGKELDKMVVSLYDNMDDSIMRFYLNQGNFTINNGILLSEEAFNKVKDSIYRKMISHSDSSGSFYVHLDPGKTINEQLYCTYRRSDYSRASWSGSFKCMDQPHPFNYYTFSRSLVPNSYGDYVITFKQIVNIPMDPMFKANQVGIEIPAVNLWKIDSIAQHIGVMPLKLLAHKLADRYSKPEEKVRSLFAWMQSHLRYDYEGLRSGNMVYTAEDALIKGVAVCAGYADLFNKFCKELKIPSEYITGYADNGSVGRHAWNAVMINGKWYLVDATWGERYYLTGPDYFIRNHFPEENKWTLLEEYYPFEKFMKGRVMDK